MSWIDHILIVMFGLVFPLSAMMNGGDGRLEKMNFNTESKKVLYYSNGLVLWGMTVAVLIGWWWQGRNFGQLGLQWGQLPFSGTAWLLLGLFVLLYSLDVLVEIGSETRRAKTKNHLKQKVGFLPDNATEFSHFIFLAITAGVCEEIVFRGYFITYARNVLEGIDVSLGIILALLLPALSFAVAHLYQGWKAVVKIVLMAILFGAFFLETAMLWPLMLVHIVVDLFGGLLNWYMQQEQR